MICSRPSTSFANTSHLGHGLPPPSSVGPNSPFNSTTGRRSCPKTGRLHLIQVLAAQDGQRAMVPVMQLRGI